ncbi:hypothetical protein K469DRAFT_684042 [Zopfia rhizophila CBS 207.26]|uniref:Protein kinase domain-containing protein n=1 Tax=Zopfia rhizophila CBS 207.26 TaxID=1314779 RepID=A0A6A6D9U8_9PEZI|nr:hypothetical protein K469DRAFT_684042 [Zopfia rhizophila CBS 207.26]
MSQAILVQLYYPAYGLKGVFVWKLFDRRSTTDIREQHSTHAWSKEVELKYGQFAFTDDYSAFYAELCASDDSVFEFDDEWDEMQKETLSSMSCARCTMQSPKSINVWGLFKGPTYLDSSHVLNFQSHDFAASQKVLLQYIRKAFTLQGLCKADPPPPTPRDSWQYICEDAICIVNLIRSQGILNRDVNVRNSLVCWDPLADKYKVFLINFGHCVFRQDESDGDLEVETGR